MVTRIPIALATIIVHQSVKIERRLNNSRLGVNKACAIAQRPKPGKVLRVRQIRMSSKLRTAVTNNDATTSVRLSSCMRGIIHSIHFV